MEKLNLGQLIEGEQGRDAIHVAVFPVIAGEKLSAGDHIGFLKNGSVGQKLQKTIGIVDPFLRKVVQPGQKFWMFLYPNTITSLRHEWTHPEVEKAEKEQKEEKQRLDLNDVSETQRAINWIKGYASTVPVSYEELMSAAESYLKTGEYFIQGGRFESESVPEEFWIHYRTITGNEGSGSFYSCSC